MCWCRPTVRTPHCGSATCTSAAVRVAVDTERNRIIVKLQSFRARYLSVGEIDATVEDVIKCLERDNETL